MQKASPSVRHYLYDCADTNANQAKTKAKEKHGGPGFGKIFSDAKDLKSRMLTVYGNFFHASEAKQKGSAYMSVSAKERQESQSNSSKYFSNIFTVLTSATSDKINEVMLDVLKKGAAGTLTVKMDKSDEAVLSVRDILV